MSIQRFPAGYYALGLFNTLHDVNNPNSPYIVRRWSTQTPITLHPDESRTYDVAIDRPIKAFSIHTWGLCRLVSLTLGAANYYPEDGALFIGIDQTVEPNCILRVTIKALEFEFLHD
jgi:hypothetical protein